MKPIVLSLLTVFVATVAGAQTQYFFYPQYSGSIVYSAAGTVGIGTPVVSGVTTPNANLQIGAGTEQGLLNLGGYGFVGSLRSSGDLFLGMNVKSLYTNSAENGVFRVYGTNAYGFSGMQMGYNGDISFYAKKGNVTAGDQANGAADLQMKIYKGPSGYTVGIGTSSACNCKLAVEGKIVSREVQVLATGLPDYVFDKDYKLPSLDEVRSYIDQNHHLPEVPSAAEVEKDGLNLGDMNMILLKKIEELTLYLIETRDENSKLRKRIENLEKK